MDIRRPFRELLIVPGRGLPEVIPQEALCDIRCVEDMLYSLQETGQIEVMHNDVVVRTLTPRGLTQLNLYVVSDGEKGTTTERLDYDIKFGWEDRWQEYDSKQWFDAALQRHTSYDLQTRLERDPLTQEKVFLFVHYHVAEVRRGFHTWIDASKRVPFSFVVQIDNEDDPREEELADGIIHESIHGVYRSKGNGVEQIIRETSRAFYRENTNFAHRMLEVMLRKVA